MTAPLLRLSAHNFRSLRRVDVDLGPLNVLVGPNQAGKSNLLDAIAFLGDAARYDLAGALERRGGIERVRFRGGASETGAVSLHVTSQVTTHSHMGAPDDYDLSFYSRKIRRAGFPDRQVLVRSEELTFKRTQGRGRRLTVSGDKAEFLQVRGQAEQSEFEFPLRSDSLALSTLRRLPRDQGGEEIERIAQLFTTFRVFNTSVERAREPAALEDSPLADDASNLASVLVRLREDEDKFGDLVADARSMVPGLVDIEFESLGGSGPAVSVCLVEKGLRNVTYLRDASYGAVRVLALLALLYDPDPPQLTCIEEIDQGLHPYVLDRLVERVREASSKTQFIITTHSPSFVNRLKASELLVCEKAPDGSTRLPAVTYEEVRLKEAAVGDRLGLGEIWFSGSLGGVPT